jgi:hypothetical protein
MRQRKSNLMLSSMLCSKKAFVGCALHRVATEVRFDKIAGNRNE